MREGVIRAQATLSKKSIIALAVSLLLTGVPLLVQAAQIMPNPNPAGSTLDIINDPSAVNNDNPYYNGGTINIDAHSTLTNTVGATLNNYPQTIPPGGTLNNAGTLINYGTLGNVVGTLTNSVGATLNNYGGLYNVISATLNNAGTLNNFAGATLVAADQAAGLNNAGTLNNFAGATLTTGIDTGHVVNSVGGTLNNYGIATIGQIGFKNAGTINNFGSWRGGELTNSVGGTLNNFGKYNISYSLINAGTLNNFAGATLTAESIPFLVDIVKRSPV